MNHFLFFCPKKLSQHFTFLVPLTISALSLSRPQNQSQNFPFLVPGSRRWRSLERCTSGRRCHPCQTQQPPSASPGGFNLKSSFLLGRTSNIDRIEPLNFWPTLIPFVLRLAAFGDTLLGKPKGVMLSHLNIVSATLACIHQLGQYAPNSQVCCG